MCMSSQQFDEMLLLSEVDKDNCNFGFGIKKSFKVPPKMKGIALFTAKAAGGGYVLVVFVYLFAD